MKLTIKTDKRGRPKTVTVGLEDLGNGAVGVTIDGWYVLELMSDGTFRRVGCAGTSGVEADTQGRIIESLA